MLRPEDMTYMNISIHRNRIPAFINEIPKQKIHIVEFKEEKEKKPHHLRREHQFKVDEEMQQQKIHEIEENLIFYFQNMHLNPEVINPCSSEERYKIEGKSVEDLINVLHEKTSHQIRRLKGYIKEKKLYSEKLEKFHLKKEILQNFDLYEPNSTVFTWFDQLKIRLFYCSQSELVDLEVVLENEEIPVILEFFKIREKKTAFFIIYHHAHEKKINELTKEIEEIKNLREHYDEDGLNLEKINEEIDFAQNRISRAIKAISDAKKEKKQYHAYLEILSNCKKYISLEKRFRETYRNEIVRIEAVVPTRRYNQVINILDEKFHNHIRIVSHPMSRTGREMDKEKKQKKETYGTEADEYEYTVDIDRIKKVNIPTLMETRKLFKPFRLLTDLYGTTNYKEMDPTPFVAFTYPLLFGLMFGDMGHGFILILTGFFLTLIKRKEKSKIRDGGFLLMWLGIFAMVGGFLYGEAFGYHLGHFIEPIIGNPLESENVTTVLQLAILIGVIHISLGWLIAMLNDIQNGKVYLALVDPLQKILILGGGAYVIFTYRFNIAQWFSSPYPFLLPVVPTIVLLLGKAIGRLMGIKYLKEDSVGEIIGEQAIDVSETYLSILSNVASYSRLLALAMAHVGLMFMVTQLGNLIGESWILTSLVLIIGNLFVILIEAIIVGIHALRLTFYEFFGKFYLGDGVPYDYVQIENLYSEIQFNYDM